MFGLMRAKKCGVSASEKHFRRLNYCGTCKTIGTLYGQKSRFLLNHDAVFLAEILTALGGADVSGWNKSYQSYNCLSLPSGEMPLSLQFAATTNVMLTKFKLADHLADEGGRRYRLAQNAFFGEFHQAETLLKGWNFPLAEVKAVLQTQTRRESAPAESGTVALLENFAAPTAAVTALFFAEGAKLVDRNDVADAAHKLGAAFGKLIYLLDAFEDYEKDFRAGQFNALRAAFALSEKELSPPVKRKIATRLRELESAIVEEIRALPIADDQKSLFTARLADNLQRKLGTNLPVLKAGKVCAAPPRSFAQKWRTAQESARNLAKNYSWQMPLVFLFVFACALVAPAQVKETKSARECFDLSFNLMFLGTFVGAVLAAPVLTIQKHAPDLLTGKAEKKRRSSWCDACDCACCDCDCDCGCCECDCCCDGCNCD